MNDCTWSNICDRGCSQLFNGEEAVKYQIQDGVCQESLLLEACCFDGGDCSCHHCRCPTCPAQLKSIHNWLGDGVCDPDLDSQDCCYDLGDCWSSGMLAKVNADLKIGSFCTTCPIMHAGRVEDGICDKHLFNQECCFDGTDCYEMKIRCETCVHHPDNGVNHEFGDMVCNPILDTEECCFDEGDCLVFDEICPTCKSTFHNHNFGDGICDHRYNSEACCFDNYDCSDWICPSCMDADAGLLVANNQCNLRVIVWLNIHVSRRCSVYLFVMAAGQFLRVLL